MPHDLAIKKCVLPFKIDGFFVDIHKRILTRKKYIHTYWKTQIAMSVFSKHGIVNPGWRDYCSPMVFLLVWILFISLSRVYRSHGLEMEDTFHMIFMNGDKDMLSDTVWKRFFPAIIVKERDTKENGSSPSSKRTTNALIWLGTAEDRVYGWNHFAEEVKQGGSTSQASSFHFFLQTYVNAESTSSSSRENGSGSEKKGHVDVVDNVLDSTEELKSSFRAPYAFSRRTGNAVADERGDIPFLLQLHEEHPGTIGSSFVSLQKEKYYFKEFPASPSSMLSTFFVNSVCLISLDVFSGRSPPPDLDKTIFHRRSRTPPRYYEHFTWKEKKYGQNGDDLLGESQWEWLESILSTRISSSGVPGKNLTAIPMDSLGSSSAEGSKDKKRYEKEEGHREHCAVMIIASPWQILLNDNKPLYGWDWYPASRSRLLYLLQKYKVTRFLFLSGHSRGIAELGNIRRALPEKVLPENRILRLYAARAPIIPPTNWSAELLPLNTSLVEVSSSFSSTRRFQDNVPRFFRLILNAFYLRGIHPTFNESESPTNFIPRYIALHREFHEAPSVGTFRITQNSIIHPMEWKGMLWNERKEAVLGAFQVTLALHHLRSDDRRKELELLLNELEDRQDPLHHEELIVYSSSLRLLPSFDESNGSNTSSRVSAVEGGLSSRSRGFPLFVVYSTPREYPFLKRLVIAFNCPDFGCLSVFTCPFSNKGWSILLFLVVCIFISFSKQCACKEQRKRKQQ